MTESENSMIDRKFVASSVAAYVQFGALLLLLWLCLKIVQPFIGLVVWGIVIAVAAQPYHASLSRKIGDRPKLSSVIMTMLGIAIIVIPAWILADSTISGLQSLSTSLEDGTIDIPPPGEDVAEWPLVGEKLYALWSQAESNLEGLLNKFEPQLKSFGETLLGAAASGAGGVLQMILSMIIAGALLNQAAPSYRITSNFFSQLMGPERGPSMALLSVSIIRSVVKGILGIALIQTVMGTLGMIVMGVPGAGLLGFVVLVVAIIQLPPILVLGPVAIWVYSFADPIPATVFLVYSIVVSSADAFLKPLLLGRGVEVPMLVILIGAIGGAVAMGIIGLFLGAVILALGYELLIAWLNPKNRTTSSEPAKEEHSDAN